MGHYKKRKYEYDSEAARKKRAEEKYPDHVARSREVQRFYRDVTADAERRGLPWTESEDDELLHGEGTTAEIALRIGRTYNSAKNRIDKLRDMIERGVVVRYDEHGKTVAPGHVLCPCGTTDDDHSTWCPMHPDNAPLYRQGESSEA